MITTGMMMMINDMLVVVTVSSTFSQSPETVHIFYTIRCGLTKQNEHALAISKHTLSLVRLYDLSLKPVINPLCNTALLKIEAFIRELKYVFGHCIPQAFSKQT